MCSINRATNNPKSIYRYIDLQLRLSNSSVLIVQMRHSILNKRLVEGFLANDDRCYQISQSMRTVPTKSCAQLTRLQLFPQSKQHAWLEYKALPKRLHPVWLIKLSASKIRFATRSVCRLVWSKSLSPSTPMSAQRPGCDCKASYAVGTSMKG